MQPYRIYFKEFLLRIFYIIVSYILCWVIFLNHIEVLLLFETLPFLLNFNEKRFIITQLTQLLTIIWFFNSWISCILIFPLVMHHFKYFFLASWYKYQSLLFQNLLKVFFLSFILTYLLIHFLLLPNIFSFFLQWENLDKRSLLKIEAEVTLISYINWVFSFKYLISFFISNFSFLVTLLSYFIEIFQFYLFILSHKKLLIFLVFFFFIVFLPPDLTLELLLIIFIYKSMELLFFYVCLKLYICNKFKIFKNANP